MPRYKATVPHMGAGSIVLKSLLDELGFEAVLPPPTTRETVSLGARYTPEFACLPLKVTLGNYLQAIPSGIDLVFMAGGTGPCRFGLYGETQRRILRSLGYDLPFIVVEPPQNHLTEFLALLARFLGPGFPARVPRAAAIAWAKAVALDRLDRGVLATAPLLNRARRRSLWQQRGGFIARIDAAGSLRSIGRINREAAAWLADQPRDPAEDEPLRVAIVGELLVVLEPAVNFHLEEELVLRGVAVERTVYFSAWIRDNLFKSFLRLDWQRQIREAAAPYLTRFVGGHALETVAHTIQAAEAGGDGVIHLAPLGCMPETIALDALRRIGADRNFPVFSLLLDEHTGHAGVSTRLEAFLDLMRARKRSLARRCQ